MVAQYIVRRFIKNHSDTTNEVVRTKYGFLGGIVGILSNIFLFFIKLFAGMLSNSIATIADAFNNLSDCLSSIITIIGFRLSNRPADEKHPFGYGRIEYLSALLVSFMVILVGYEFVKSSFQKILHPTPLKFQLLPFFLILFSILVKVWLSQFNSYISKTIHSTALKASSFDALMDVIGSSCIAFSLLLSRFTAFPIDGYLGMGVALLIFYTGIQLIRETISPILGSAPDTELVESIKSKVMSYEYISGVHDLVIHSYGPGRYMATIHAEVPADIGIVKMHDIIDKAEKEISKEMNLFIVIHMDPINVKDEDILKIKNDVVKVMKAFPIVKSIHDFRVVREGALKNLIFDLVVDSSKKLNSDAESELKNEICGEVKKYDESYNCIITIDKDFMHL